MLKLWCSPLQWRVETRLTVLHSVMVLSCSKHQEMQLFWMSLWKHELSGYLIHHSVGLFETRLTSQRPGLHLLYLTAGAAFYIQENCLLAGASGTSVLVTEHQCGVSHQLPLKGKLEDFFPSHTTEGPAVVHAVTIPDVPQTWHQRANQILVVFIYTAEQENEQGSGGIHIYHMDHMEGFIYIPD